MKELVIEIADKEYKVLLAETDEERIEGLSNYESLDSDRGMLFTWPELQEEVEFNTIDMKFDIDIIAINDDDEVFDVVLGKAGSNDIFVFGPDKNIKIKYVLEVNANSGIKEGDELDIKDDETEVNDSLWIIGPNGKPQYELKGGERICSRRESKILISKAKRAYKEKSDSSYKSLGKYMFKVLKGQNERPSEYVQAP